MRGNVLQLINSFDQGGSERQAVQLARLLSEGGRYRVRVACLDGGGVLRGAIKRLKLGEVPEYPLNSFYDGNAVMQLRRFARFLRENEIDVVHTHDFYTNIFGMAAAWIARVPVRIASRRQGAVRAAHKRVVERSAYRIAHAVVANCEAVRRQLIVEGVGAKKIVTVYNGVDASRVASAAATHDELLAAHRPPRHEGRRFVTVVANLRPVKDHATFLRAARRVRDGVPQAAFMLAGEGRARNALEGLTRQLGLERDVFFVGQCETVAPLLALSDVCVLSSRSEGFSNAILEYMAAARPVVATAVGGAAEAIIEGETGHLVAAGDDEAMAARIISLLRDPERAKAMGEAGRRVTRQKFSCEGQLERIQNLYDRLLADARPVAGRAPEGGRRKQSRPDSGPGVETLGARGEF